VNIVYDSKRRQYAEENATEFNLIVRTGKSEAEVTNDNRRRSTYYTVEANYRRSMAWPVCDSRATCYLTHANINSRWGVVRTG